MNFNKATYWKRRNNVVKIKDNKGKVLEKIPTPLPGQSDPIKPRLIPKDEKVTIVNSAGKTVDFPNASGRHAARVGGKLTWLNRKQSRQHEYGGADRSYTRRGFKGHAVNEPHQGKHSVELPTHTPYLSNHDRMVIRAGARQEEATNGKSS